MPFCEPLPTLTRPLGSERAYRLVGTLRHTAGDEVADGYATDLASIPRAFHWLLPPQGPYEAAAVRHDRRCDLINAGDPCEVSPRRADHDFRVDLRVLGMGPIRAWVMWMGVRLGALANRHRRPGSLATLPGVLLLLLLHLWIAIPTVICAAAVVTLDVLEGEGGRRRARRRAARHDGARDPETATAA